MLRADPPAPEACDSGSAHPILLKRLMSTSLCTVRRNFSFAISDRRRPVGSVFALRDAAPSFVPAGAPEIGVDAAAVPAFHLPTLGRGDGGTATARAVTASTVVIASRARCSSWLRRVNSAAAFVSMTSPTAAPSPL